MQHCLHCLIHALPKKQIIWYKRKPKAHSKLQNVIPPPPDAKRLPETREGNWWESYLSADRVFCRARMMNEFVQLVAADFLLYCNMNELLKSEHDITSNFTVFCTKRFKNGNFFIKSCMDLQDFLWVHDYAWFVLLLFTNIKCFEYFNMGYIRTEMDEQTR